MQKINYSKICSLILFLLVTVYATNSKSDLFDSIDKGLSSVEDATQTGRQVMDAGTTTASTVASGEIALVDTLVSKLGVSQQQALGGAGSIFQLAQGNMDPQSFTTLSQSIPGMDDMLNAAPVMPESVTNLTGGLSSLVGDSNNSLGNLATLTNSFQQLDLSPDMVGKFIPVVTEYVSNTSGQVATNLLQSALAIP
ncbi:MAG: DUF2780 domain-containing protein [Betaproteobacteria bacterium]|nr:DUF2780 domain-containing protein [Betaproteobacteria bacterium]